jgi:hypothetical protein
MLQRAAQDISDFLKGGCKIPIKSQVNVSSKPGNLKSTNYGFFSKSLFLATEVLNEGIPTATEVYADGFRYFEHQLSSINDLWIEVKPQHWRDEPYLCISNTVKKPRNVDDNCTWRQYGFDGIAHITIPKSEVKVGFYIGGRFVIIFYLLFTVDGQMIGKMKK